MAPEVASYHHGDLRRALLAAALEVIRDEGVAALTLRGLARRVGVSANAPYHHFGDRAALVAAVAEEGFQLLREAMVRSATKARGGALAALRAGVLAYVRFAIEHTAHYRLMFTAELPNKAAHPALASAAKAAYNALVEMVANGQAAGQIRRGDPIALSRTIWALFHGLSVLLIDGLIEGNTVGGVDGLTAATVETLVDGLASRR